MWPLAAATASQEEAEPQGLPLTESVTAANVHGTHELFPLVDSVAAVRMPSGQRRHRPRKPLGDKAYASRKNRRGLRLRGIAHRIARPGVESKERLGRYRWVVERTLAWKNPLRRLRGRYERRDDVHFGFLVLGCCLMRFRRLGPDICQALSIVRLQRAHKASPWPSVGGMNEASG
ncbi:transposase [Myxococcus virescens]|uniref:Transposase IS4-like domain-containing protein n=1 Tax=Myxococcus virescens TaxID=83456 RepID=A0A511HI26_9BACT|nr:transposase [Myxococcus virescens]GEL73227.1 hypothetical protein MVI01_50110 [Myxococcus virescens]